MSFEEPKAPIVRIRKKRVKKKSKDNDIVHLPVRASQQARYSSLTTPPNPQTKSRECCRHAFASCMKIPVCRLICFRCILPKCYAGEGSDDDEGDIKDEGYHSQNRRSSEISPHPEGGAQGGSEPQEVEMTEIKGETVNLIPPPRTYINDYRRDPCKNKNLNGNDSNGEVTYIEVESISLDNESQGIIPKSNSQSGDTCLKEPVTIDTEYEEPIRVGVLDFPLLKPLETVDSSEYVECDNSDDESKYYVNESVLGIHVETTETASSSVGKTTSSIKQDTSLNYMNLDSVKEDSPSKPKVKPIVFVESKTELEIVEKSLPPHEYVNLNSLQPKDDSGDQIVETVKGVQSNDKKQTNDSNDLNEAQNDVTDVKVTDDNHECLKSADDSDNGTDVDNVVTDKCSDKKKLIENDKPADDSDSETSDSNDGDLADETRQTNDQTKLI